LFVLSGCGQGQPDRNDGEIIFSALNGVYNTELKTLEPVVTPALPDTNPPGTTLPAANPPAEPNESGEPSETGDPLETPPPTLPSPPPVTNGGGTSTPSALTTSPLIWNVVPGGGGNPPTGNHSAAFLRPFSAFYRGGETDFVYLTFELTYEAGYTEAVLDTLLALGISAAFFVTLPYMENNDDLVKRMTEEGHVVGLLTFRVLSDLTEDEIGEEILYPARFFSENFGRPIDPFLRPAKGAYSEFTLSLTRHYGFFTIFWSAGFSEWVKAADSTHPGMVLSLSGFHSNNINTLQQTIINIQGKGFTFVSLYHLI
jgi:peptidoglycan-N-acetylmuramic acid deacetylase